MQRFHKQIEFDDLIVFHVRPPDAAFPRYSEISELFARKGYIAATLVFAKPQNSEEYFMGIALCGNRDQFCRKVGRAIAVGRAKKLAAQALVKGVSAVHGITEYPEERKDRIEYFRAELVDIVESYINHVSPFRSYYCVPDHVQISTTIMNGER